MTRIMTMTYCILLMYTCISLVGGHIFCSLVTRQDTVKPAHVKEPILVSQNGTRPIQVVFQTVPPSDFK